MALSFGIQHFIKQAPRQLRLTPTGRVLVVVAFCAGLFALTTGNNLLFLGWSMVLASIVVSGILSELTLRALDCQTLANPLFRAKAPNVVTLQITNLSRFIPCFSFELYADAVSMHGKKRFVSAHQLHLLPGQRITLPVVVTFDERGTYRIDAWSVVTAYPFGFFQKSKRFKNSAQQLLCAPQKIDVGHYIQKIKQTSQKQDQDTAMPDGEEFFGLRPFRTGDNWRRIHWRRSAKQGAPMVVEFAAAHPHTLMLCLEMTHSETPKDAYALAVLASLSERLLDSGWRIGIQCAAVSVPVGVGLPHAIRILQALARDALGAQTLVAPHAWGVPSLTLVTGEAKRQGGPSNQLDIGVQR